MAPKRIKQPTRVLVVCHGNICRSPLVGAILKRELGEENVRDCGTSSKQGVLAAKKVRDYALTHCGIDLAEHRSRQVICEDINWADLVLYMDRGNRMNLVGMFGYDCLQKSTCAGQYINESRIPDPNYTKRGPKLDAMLDMAVRAAKAAASAIKNA